MRKIVMMNRISLDGFFAGPNGEIDWFNHDTAVDEAAHNLMQPNTLLLGRLTYEMFAGYWPPIENDASAPAPARNLSREMNQMKKVVFSTTLQGVDWQNSTLVSSDIIPTVKALKQGEGADITIFGSGTIVQQLAKAGLIDEWIITLTPAVLGQGKALFDGVPALDFALAETRNFDSGNVLLHYKVR